MTTSAVMWSDRCTLFNMIGHADDFRIQAAERGYEMAMERSRSARAAASVVSAQAVALMRQDGVSDREIARRLGINKAQVVRLASPVPTASQSGEVRDLAFSVWRDTQPGESGWSVDQSVGLSQEVLQGHGIKSELLRGSQDTSAREFVHADGRRLVVFTQARWDGLTTTGDPSGDGRGQYFLEACPGRTGSCAPEHEGIPVTKLGLPDGADLFGSGYLWPCPRDGEVAEVVLTAVKQAYKIFDPFDAVLARLRSN